MASAITNGTFSSLARVCANSVLPEPVGPINDQLFYLQSRGLSKEQATAMIVNGFMEPVTRTLPREFAVEWSRLVELQMEGSIG